MGTPREKRSIIRKNIDLIYHFHKKLEILCSWYISAIDFRKWKPSPSSEPPTVPLHKMHHTRLQCLGYNALSVYQTQVSTLWPNMRLAGFQLYNQSLTTKPS